MKYRVKKDFLLKDIAGESIVIPRGTAALDFNGTLVLNEACALLWKSLSDFTTCEELATILVKEYNIEQEIAVRDVEKCVAKMEQYELLDVYVEVK